MGYSPSRATTANVTRAIGTTLILLAAIGFGTIGIFGKLGFDAGLNNPTILTFRFLIATVFLTAFLWFTGRGEVVTGKPLYIATGLGIAYALLAAGFFWGLVYITAGLASITLYTFPIYVYLISVVLLGERLTGLKLIAIVLAIGGVLAIVGLDVGNIDLRGIVLVSLAAMAYAIYTTGSRVAVADIDADVLATVAIGVSAAVFLLYGLISGTVFLPAGIDQWGVILGLALFGTAIPIVLFVHGLELIEASRASIVAMAEPPVTVILGVVLLGEILTIGILIGGTMILIGILLIQRDRTVARPAVSLPTDE